MRWALESFSTESTELNDLGDAWFETYLANPSLSPPGPAKRSTTGILFIKTTKFSVLGIIRTSDTACKKLFVLLYMYKIYIRMYELLCIDYLIKIRSST